MTIRPNGRCQRVAHRGGAALAPENTLAAFRHALRLPVDAIELDVQMSRDGHALVFHDETVERLTEGQGNILDLDLADLQALNVAAHFPGGWPRPERMPLLREVLALARAANVRVYIEIKPGKRGGAYVRYPGIAEAVVQEVRAADLLGQVLIISFDWEILLQVKALAPDVETGALVSEDVWNPHTPGALTDLIKRVNVLQCAWIDLDVDLFTPEMPELFHTYGYRLGVWTVNNEADLRRLAKAGVDSLTSDRPDLFRCLEE